MNETEKAKEIERIIEETVEHDAFGLHRVDEAAAEIAGLLRKERGKPTDWHVLLKRIGEEWVALKCVNPLLHEEDEIPEEWDVVLSIPEPDSIPEFTGW